MHNFIKKINDYDDYNDNNSHVYDISHFHSSYLPMTEWVLILPCWLGGGVSSFN